jgi:hypothetical protein
MPLAKPRDRRRVYANLQHAEGMNPRRPSPPDGKPLTIVRPVWLGCSEFRADADASRDGTAWCGILRFPLPVKAQGSWF